MNKIKKILSWVIPMKSFAAMIFAGFIGLYMVTGGLYAVLWNDSSFNYTIPFIFILQGLVLSVLISILWNVILGEGVIKRMRYLPRLIIFSASLMAMLAVCLLVFFAIPTEWAKLWLIIAGGVCGVIIFISVLCEIYYKMTGRRYTEILQDYKSNIIKK